MEVGKNYDCYAESAEIQTTEPKNGVYWVMLVAQYRFPESGKVMPYRHFLASRNIETNTSELKVDKSGVSEKEKLETRYGVSLNNFEFDQNKLSPEIIVQALIVADNYKGKTGIKIGFIREKFKNESKPADKAALMRDFGALFRATSPKPATAPTVHAPNSAPPKASPPKATPPTPPKAPEAPEAPKGSQGAEPPPHKAAPSTAEECWSLFRSLEGNKARTDNDVGPDFWDLIQRTFGHQQQERLTPADWGTLKEKIVDMETMPF